MKDETYQIIGLAGFILAGLIFVVVGLKAGDMLTVIASLIWTASCIVWMVPLMKNQRK
ncbi:MAG: hypothetical protein V3U96_08780 [Paracoccaceae bacterium]